MVSRTYLPRIRTALGDRAVAMPTVTVGDFKMDFEFATERGNEAFIEMLGDNVWQWVRPAELIDTNWSDTDGDGLDNFPDSMLDFVFVVELAKDWQPESIVLVRERDFPDDATTATTGRSSCCWRRECSDIAACEPFGAAHCTTREPES